MSLNKDILIAAACLRNPWRFRDGIRTAQFKERSRRSSRSVVEENRFRSFEIPWNRFVHRLRSILTRKRSSKRCRRSKLFRCASVSPYRRGTRFLTTYVSRNRSRDEKKKRKKQRTRGEGKRRRPTKRWSSPARIGDTGRRR